MSTATGTAEGVVEVDYHQFYFAESMDAAMVEVPVTFPDFAGAIGPGVVVIRTNIAMGPAGVTVRALDGPPDDQGDWEDDAEMSLVTSTGEFSVIALLGDAADGLRHLKANNGTYRLRVRAQGRHDPMLYDKVVKEPSEFYLLDFWPA